MKTRMTRKPLTILTIAALLTTLTACDIRNAEVRENAIYQTAMDDYAAGRLDAAVKGFARAVGEMPSDARARFQLACLQQDHVGDWLSAICNYREYLLSHPKDEKADVARARLAICEKAYVDSIVERAVKEQASGSDSLAAKLAEAERANARLTEELAAAKAKVARLEGEIERQRRLISSVGEEAEDERVDLSAASKLSSEKDDESGRLEIGADIAELIADADAEDAEAGEGASILPPSSAASATGKPLVPVAKKEADEDKSDSPSRPATYIVEEGDTLSAIASRFYGTKSAWKRIREANKTTISTDGRVRAGQEIVLP